MMTSTVAVATDRGEGFRVVGRLVLATFLFACLVFGQTNSAEDFDLTGLPPKATNFAEQHLMDMIDRHRAGDLPDAVAIQHKLATYYRQKGDNARARIAEERAQSVEPSGPSQAGEPAPANPGGQNSPPIGKYACRSMGSRPCDSKATLALDKEGGWTWTLYEGHYEVEGNTVTFTGVLSNWGSAEIGPDTLTFMSGQQKVVWQKPSSLAPSGLSGRYQCFQQAGGCLTRIPIELQADGSYTWGRRGGSYTVIGDVIKFGGTTTSPAGWGLCNLVNGALVFHMGQTVSEWRKLP